MKKIMLAVILFSVALAQVQSMQKVKMDRKMETLLVTLFEAKPQSIELFMTEDGNYVVEATYEGQRITKNLTAEEYKTLMEKPVDKYAILGNARVPYLIGQTALGLCVYSWTLPVSFLGTESFDDDTWRTYTAIGLVTPLVYSSALFIFTRNTRISGGAAYGAFLGGIEGCSHGSMLFDSPRAIFPASLAENFTDYALGQTMGFTPSMFQRKFNHTIYGYYHYLAVLELVGSIDAADDKNTMRFSTLVSLGEGYTSLFLSRKADYLTYGDALFELRASAMGASAIPLVLASIDLYSSDMSIDENVYIGTSLAGFAAGYWFGNRLSCINDLPGTAGLLTFFIPALCDLAAAGVGVLVNSDGYYNSLPVIILATDFTLTTVVYKSLTKKATVGLVPLHDTDGTGLSFYFNPAPLLCKNEYIKRMPIASLSWNF